MRRPPSAGGDGVEADDRALRDAEKCDPLVGAFEPFILTTSPMVLSNATRTVLIRSGCNCEPSTLNHSWPYLWDDGASGVINLVSGSDVRQDEASGMGCARSLHPSDWVVSHR